MVRDFAIVFTLSISPEWKMISTNLSWTLATQFPGKVMRIWASFQVEARQYLDELIFIAEAYLQIFLNEMEKQRPAFEVHIYNF